jgi:hypothetical protein
MHGACKRCSILFTATGTTCCYPCVLTSTGCTYEQLATSNLLPVWRLRVRSAVIASGIHVHCLSLTIRVSSEQLIAASRAGDLWILGAAPAVAITTSLEHGCQNDALMRGLALHIQHGCPARPVAVSTGCRPGMWPHCRPGELPDGPTMSLRKVGGTGCSRLGWWVACWCGAASSDRSMALCWDAGSATSRAMLQ